jgi:hypothetical protein
MSHPGYECLHVPVHAARTRLFGIPAWLLVAVVLVVTGKVYGPWVFLAPVLLLAATLTVVVLLATRRATHAATDSPDGSGDGPAGGEELMGLTGLRLVCVGCGQQPATSVLAAAGYQLPVCAGCRTVAETRLDAPSLPHPITTPPLARSLPDGATHPFGGTR